ncbi:hypothetical protein PNP59_14095 [Halobacterium salinarum]|uniref:hypothetical protein n=1 Tax=Halobacterium salinarum TaxID=2242 RepID=UPI0025579274|nr:hypothetical protein [Halobacterium salinarum]MDL0132037.1 hypothetical protein [Halobacterium salinarum]
MIRGSDTAVSKLKSGDVEKMPKTYCWRLLCFGGNLPDDVHLDLHQAIHRFQMNVAKARYRKEGAFYDAIAMSTNLTDQLIDGAPERISFSMPGLGKQIYDLWRDHLALNPDSREEAIHIIANHIADAKNVPHRNIPHEKRVEYLRRLPSQSEKLRNTPFYESVPIKTSVSFDQFFPESDLTNAVIKSTSDYSGKLCTPEMHYSHYGNRGSVDLFVEGVHLDQDLPTSCKTYVLEMKSASAISHSTGANSIIQQFNKMREYFFKGVDPEDINSVSDYVKFELAFTPSEDCIEHLFNYEEMYRSCLSQQLVPDEDVWPSKQNPSEDTFPKVSETISIRIPDPKNPVSIDVFRRREGPDPADIKNYKKYLLRKSPRFYDNFWQLFADYSQQQQE